MPRTAIRLVISDVDGTIVDEARRLTRATIEAAARLKDAGIALALVSARPPAALRDIVATLGLETPRAGFNGAIVETANGEVASELLIDADTTRHATRRLDVWIFSHARWYLTNPDAHYIASETRSISAQFEQVPSFDPYLSQAHKIIGASRDTALVARMAAELRESLGAGASVTRSQDYYVELTHTLADKGRATEAVAAQLGIPLDATLCIGDMHNDLAMFRVAGRSVAMGNAPEGIRREADYVVADNEHDGWAEMVQRLLAGGLEG
jgi:Cof subfamily protein (haloacid dehalogenase superfamily)